LLLLWRTNAQYDAGGIEGLLFLSAPLWAFVFWLPVSIIHEFALVPRDLEIILGLVFGFVISIVIDRLKNVWFRA
jgi:hypothetical protein